MRLAVRHWLLAAFAAAILVAAAPPALAQTPDGPPEPSPWHHLAENGELRVDLYFVWSETCPHCRAARPFVEGLPERYPWLVLHSLRADSSADVATADRLAASIGEEIRAVPAFLLCEQLYVGYDSDEGMGAFLADRAEACHAAGGRLAGPSHQAESAACPADAGACAAEPAAQQPLHLPVLGDVDASAVSLPAFTVAVAALDAFNPCAFFVLLFLLSLLVHARSRLRMLVIGGTFVLVSGAAYFVFMAAWLNVFRLTGELRVVTTVAGVVAMAFALVNVKDYFLWGRGPSLSIPDGAKPGLFRRMRSLTAGTRYPALLAGTVTLAVAANSYELLCTAGFPMVYTRVLTLNDLPTAGYYAYLGLYAVVYVVPLLVIVGLFVWRLGSRKLGEAEGRVLKLASGLMMLGLGSLLVVDPAALANLGAAAAVLAGAVAATALVVAADRWYHRAPA